MLPYWIFFLVPAAAALVSSPHMRFRAGGTRSLHINETWILIILVLTMIIGFRYEVGGDWGNYFRYLFDANNLTFADLATKKDPGYWALNVLSVTTRFRNYRCQHARRLYLFDRPRSIL